MISWIMLSFFCFILRHLLEGFLDSVKSPFRGCHFNSEKPLYSSHSPHFRARKPRFIILCVQSVSLQHLTYSKNSLAGDSLYSCLPFFFSLLSKPLCTLAFFLATIFLHFSHVLFFFHHFPKPSTVRLLPRELSPLTTCQWFFLFCLQRIVVTFLA